VWLILLILKDQCLQLIGDFQCCTDASWDHHRKITNFLGCNLNLLKVGSGRPNSEDSLCLPWINIASFYFIFHSSQVL
jgi:hypothetical protein